MEKETCEEKNNNLYKNSKEYKIIGLVLIGLILIGISSYTSFAVFSDEVVSNNEIKGVVKEIMASDYLISKVGTDGIVADTHASTSQTSSTVDYRYTGKNPNNYIKFNDEVWRIIGAFEVRGDDGTKYRLKLIRDSIGEVAWNSSSVNDWSKASGMTLLNSGDYYNRTGSYASNGLTASAKTLITNAKWYLGGIEVPTGANVADLYNDERGNEVYTGRPISWTGKVGLMYPSDYGYATSGGSTTNREACLAKEVYNWDGSSVSDCKDNDWLYDSNNYQWTISVNSSGGDRALEITASSYLNNPSVNSTHIFRPTVYLRNDIKIVGGDGSSTNPYQLSI